jgi:O-antigen/teichoic acid export membrane protein
MPDVEGGVVRRIYGNLGKLLSGKAAAGLIGLAYMVVAARALGPTDYGVLVLVHTFATTVGGIVEFPGWHAIVRFGSLSQAAGDGHRTMRLLRFVGLVELTAGTLAVATATVLGPILGPRLGWTSVAIAFAVPYAFAVLGSVRSTAAGYLQLAGRFDLLGYHNMVAPGVRLIGAGVVWLLHAGLLGFLIAWLVAALAEWASLWTMALVVARRRLSDVPLLGPVGGVTRDNPGLWRFMVAANADVTLAELAPRIAPLVIGWMLGPEAVGLYAIAQRATVVIAQPAQILGQAAYAELARLVAGGDTGQRLRRAVIHCTGIAVAAALPVIAILALFGRQAAVLIGGPAYVDAGGVMLWLTVARAALLAGPPASAALIALGRPALSVAVNLVANLGLLPLLPPFLRYFGLAGAGWQAMLQSIVGSAALLMLIFTQTSDTPRRRRAVAL